MGCDSEQISYKEIKCNSLFERILKLVETGDAFIILQGGTGTLLELATVWEFMNKRLLERKPVLCHSKMWKEIVYIMDKQIEKEERVTGLIKYFANVEGMVEYLSNHFR
jgi:predicted Rossmann-fold nucleotide-binding protein